MYEAHFGFREPPFRITPDPRFLFRNACVEEAAAALAYGIERRKGFLSLVGEAGTGKTTLLRHVLDTLSGNIRTVVLLHPTVEFDEILEYILSELGIPTDGGRKLVLLQRLHEFLVEHTRGGGNVALLIDEAQDLEGRVLEELRLLSNLETGTEKILQIVLAGQPELETKLADPSLRQLRQRIALHVRLRPLSVEEVSLYIRTRLQYAGATRDDIFTPDATARIALVSQGIPRIVNVLADACLVTAYATNARQVSAAIVDEAWVDYSRLVGEPSPAMVTPVVPVAPVPLPPRLPPESVPAAVPSAPAVGPVVRAPDIIPVADLVGVPDSVVMDDPGSPPSERPTWWPSARQATVGSVVAILVMLAFNFSVRGPAPTRDTTPTPETVIGGMPVVGEDDDPLVSPPSSGEARALVHQFILAYEARDAARLAALFADGGTDNETTGAGAIQAAYERTFAQVRDVAVSIPHIDTVARGERLSLTGPLVVAFRDPAGAAGEMRGTAQWEIARHAGRPKILRLHHDVVPNGS